MPLVIVFVVARIKNSETTFNWLTIQTFKGFFHGKVQSIFYKLCLQDPLTNQELWLQYPTVNWHGNKCILIIVIIVKTIKASNKWAVLQCNFIVSSTRSKWKFFKLY